MIFFRLLKATLPRALFLISPGHTNAVQPRDLLFRQISGDSPFAHPALCDDPHPKAQASRCLILLRHF